MWNDARPSIPYPAIHFKSIELLSQVTKSGISDRMFAGSRISGPVGPTALFLQPNDPVLHQRHRLAGPLFSGDRGQDALPIGGNVVEIPRVRVDLTKQRVRCAHLERIAFNAYFRGRELSVGNIEKFPAILPPAGKQPAARRNLALAARPRERCGINLEAAGFIGGIRDPAAIRRKLWISLSERRGPHERGRLERNGATLPERQSPYVAAPRK